ncbi:MAG: hypothetical protein R2734_07500 [Nocardioides sp.]
MVTAIDVSARACSGVALAGRLDFGDADLLAATWTGPTWASVGPAGLAVTAGRRPAHLVPTGPQGQVPLLATRTLPSGTPADRVVSPSAVTYDATVVARPPRPPLVEGDGLLADPPAVLSGDRPTAPAAQSYVPPRTRARPLLLRDLRAAGAGAPQTVGVVRRHVTVEAGAQAAAYAPVAGFGCGGPGHARRGSPQRERRRQEIASAAAAGRLLAAQRRSGWVEQPPLAGAAVAGGLLGGLAAVRLLLTQLPFIHPAPASARCSSRRRLGCW